MKIITRSILVLAVLTACGKKGSDTATVDLGSSGFVVDVPSGWTVESPMKGFYSFKGGRGGPQIMESEMAPGAVDDGVKSQCEGRSDVQKGTVGSGWWLTCKGESKMIKGVQTTVIVARLPKDDKTSFDCHLETDQDPALALGICKSIRKK